MKRLIAVMLVACPALACAAGPSDGLMHAGTNVHDTASVQRGAAMFVNYCMGCHEAKYMRYQRFALDLDMSEELVEELLIFGDQEITDSMTATMRKSDADEWFGVVPPDLTLAARSRGVDWLYTFLNGYYMTETGWDNTVMSNPAMPHVLWSLQGIQRPLTETWVDDYGDEHVRVIGLELERQGLLSPAEYRAATRDLVTFLEYLAEPAVLQRERIGVWVILFIALFTIFTYLLYREYWKDVKK